MISSMSNKIIHTYNDIISTENLLEAWKEFIKGKSKRRDAQEFQYKLLDNILSLHNELKTKAYVHGKYEAFNISDPKPRVIHKASVRDRVLHRAIYRILYPYFDKKFIADSFSCRNARGTHKAVNRFRSFAFKVSQNNTKTCWILKCDIKKFFASVNHPILLKVLSHAICNFNRTVKITAAKDISKDILWLLAQVVESFNTKGKIGVGLPLGNLTSQLFSNIYLNELDQFIKHKLQEKYYIRYADDFVFLTEGKKQAEDLIPKLSEFLQKELKLNLHSGKVFIKTLNSGVDFLGWVNFFDHRVLRTATKRRMFKRMGEGASPETATSYLGLLKHGNTKKLKAKIMTYYSYRC